MKKDAVKRPYNLGAREETAKLTQQSIKAAAVRLFSSRPLDLVSLDEVADEAKVTRQTVLRLYGSKEGLLSTVADEQLARADAERAQVSTGADTEQILRAHLGRYEALADNALAFHGAGERYPAMRVVIDRARKNQLRWLEQVFAAHLPAGRRRSRCLAQLYAALDIHAWKALRQDCGLTADDAVEALAATAMTLARSFR